MIKCAFCADTGQVVYAVRVEPVFEYRDKRGKRVSSVTKAHVSKQVGTAEFEEMAPCPHCDAGHTMEFPPPARDGTPRAGYWGPEGFWRGRSARDLRPVATDRQGEFVGPPEALKDLLGVVKELPA